MNRRHFLRTAALLFGLAAGHARAATINTTLLGHLAADGYDVVSYQTDHKAVKGNSDFRYQWNGATWQFVSDEHRKTFIAMPERYAPQYGGYCAFAVAKNELVDVDPEAFTVVDGKLYLNYSKKIQAQWEADRAAFIQKADRNWPGLNK